jgi:ABC-type spermidine/putrescine transport system permease subunit I
MVKKKSIKKTSNKTSTRKSKSVSARKKVSEKKVLKVKKSAPAGIKIISILIYFFAILLMIIGIALLAGAVGGSAAVVGVGLENVDTGDFGPITSPMVALIFGSLFLGGVIVIISGILLFFVARGLWRGENWARTVAIVLIVISFIDSFFSLDVLSVVIDGLIGYYLIWSRDVRAWFK